jgi:hypothetical protein
MLYDVAVLVTDELTEEFSDIVFEAFGFATPSVARTHDNRPGTEVYLTYEAHDILHAMRVVTEGMESLGSTIESVSLDTVNGDGHRPPHPLTM